jgi:aryl-alcohol dehydrogenase-like predicted oxidoreductase
MAPQLCLGTVQFGLPYGITNTAGQVEEPEVRRILAMAAQQGVELLDTAQAYGTAESVLGKCSLPTMRRRLISKLPAQADPDGWEQSFQASLNRLQTDRLDGFLLHRSADLLGPQADRLLDWLESLRERGLVHRLGVSIYDASELEGIPLDRLQLVQLPLSLYDQRLLLNGTVDQLKSAGLAVHARSLLLQGLLLRPAHQWPSFLSPDFRQHHRQLIQHLAERGLSLLDAALAFAHSCDALEAVLVGVQSAAELAELLAAWNAVDAVAMAPAAVWAWENGQDLDPRCWAPR